MPIVPGNQPPRRQKPGSLLGWVLPLLFFGPMIYNAVRSATRGMLTDQQIIIAGAGLIGLVALITIARRVGQSRVTSSSSLPTAATPPNPPTVVTPPSQPTAYAPPNQPNAYAPPRDTSVVVDVTPPASSRSGLPSPPRFEPVVTGKVFLAGVLLALMMCGVGFLLLSVTP